MKTLYPYQETGARRLAEGSCLLLDDMGLGKTVMTCVALARTEPPRVLIACPKQMIDVWIKELEECWPGSNFAAPKSFSGSATPNVPARAVVNYEKLRDCMMGAPFDVFVIDEGHKVKNRRAQRSTWSRHLAHAANVVWILTGTPILNRPDEIWHLLHLAFRCQFSSYWRFVDRWIATAASRWSKSGVEVLPRIKAGMEDAFAEMLHPYTIRRTKAMVGLDLPAVTRQVFNLEMKADQRQLHDEILTQLLVEVGEGKTLTVSNVLARSIYARRACVSPSLVGADGGSCKLDMLSEILESLEGQPVVVFSQWSEPLVRLHDAYPKSNLIHGGLSDSWRKKELEDWRKYGGPLFITTGTGGVGLTLTEAAYCVFLDEPWTPAEVEQAVARLDRIGQTRPVTAYFLRCKKSIEQDVVRALGNKTKLVELINQRLEALHGKKKH